MRHVKTITVIHNVPGEAMTTNQILLLIGTILSGIGGMLMGISQILGGKG